MTAAQLLAELKDVRTVLSGAMAERGRMSADDRAYLAKLDALIAEAEAE